MARHKDVIWVVGEDNQPTSDVRAQLAVLMDLRDELKAINQVLHCINFQHMPKDLLKLRLAIERQERKRRRSRKQTS